MGAPLPGEAGKTPGRTPGFQEPVRTQGKRPGILGFLDLYGRSITDISIVPTQGNRPAQIVILREVPSHESDPLAVAMRRFQAPLDQVAQARDWFDANSANPTGVPYDERINPTIVGPALQLVESAVGELAAQA